MTQPPTPPADSARHDPATEGLRGMAALMVIYTHMLTPFPHVDPGYAVSPFFWSVETSQGAVLLFFVLSGYVIGLTNPQPFSRTRLVNYGRRRAVRLLPLYVLAVLAGAASVPTDTWTTVTGNLFFLQNDLPYGSVSLPPVAGNTNLWSLNYEVLYYLLFPLVWLKPQRWPVWLGASAVVGVAAWWSPVAGSLTATYAVGWVFWLGGYALASSRNLAAAEETPLPWPALLFLWAAIWHLKPVWHIAHRFGAMPEDAKAWLTWSFLEFLPPCLCLLMVTTGRRPRLHRLLLLVTVALPVAFVGWTALRGRFWEMDSRSGTVFCLLGLALWPWRPSTSLFARLAPVGAISYGIYVFHSPVQNFLIGLPFLPAGSAGTFLLRSALILLVTFTVAWWTERRLQPWVKSRLVSPPASKGPKAASAPP